MVLGVDGSHDGSEDGSQDVVVPVPCAPGDTLSVRSAATRDALAAAKAAGLGVDDAVRATKTFCGRAATRLERRQNVASMVCVRTGDVFCRGAAVQSGSRPRRGVPRGHSEGSRAVAIRRRGDAASGGDGRVAAAPQRMWSRS